MGCHPGQKGDAKLTYWPDVPLGIDDFEAGREHRGYDSNSDRKLTFAMGTAVEGWVINT